MVVAQADDFASFRLAARRLLAAETPPAAVEWSDGVQASLFGAPALDSGAPSPPAFTRPVADRAEGPRVPQAFLREAEIAAEHSSPERFAVLYRLLWKLTHGEPRVLSNPLDADCAELVRLVHAVREEEHKMHAFVRFRRVRDAGARTGEASGAPHDERWVAWFRPAHPILRRVAPFFARRYPNMRWSLFTPEASAHWGPPENADTPRLSDVSALSDAPGLPGLPRPPGLHGLPGRSEARIAVGSGHELRFGPGAPRERAPAEDELDDLFLTYYASVFNPARSNVQTMERHMPKRILEQMPEGARAKSLVHDAGARVDGMKAAAAEKDSASAPLVPATHDRAHLVAAANRCRACPIGERATQVVWGEGATHARLMLVGEQPGDEEDRAGTPFVGPAGRLLDEMLEKAGLDRAQTYVTNAVKHFKWEPRGKRRLHAKPNRDEIDACRGWMNAELEQVKPKMILCLGATAAQSFAGAKFRVQRDRGKPMATPWAPWWMATYHPSALLRAPDADARRRMESELLADLTLARDHLRSLAA